MAPFETIPVWIREIPDYLKTQEMCNDWFVTQGQIDLWHDDDYWHDDDKLIKWYEGYQKRMAQKAKIKEELLPIAWHPDRVMDWCMSEDEKGQWK